MSGPTGDSWIGLRLGNERYAITEKLGEGGMGSVYRAWDGNLQTDVVVKVPLAANQYDPEANARFVREVSSLVKLTHPHIVKIIDFGEHAGQPFAVMQFLPGGSLATPEKTPSRRAADSLKGWLPSVAKALDFVHAQGYLHRDVKPANILFDAYGNAFLSDFGIMKFAAAGQEARSGKSLTGAGMVLGTPEYMAPEVILGQKADGRLDQYGLAVTVFEVLAGRRPFEDATATAVLVQQTTTQPPDIRSLNSAITPALSAVVAKALAKDPARRFASCIEFADAAVATLSGGQAALVKLKCPACGRSLKLEWKVGGRTVSCPACQTSLKVANDLSELSLAEAESPFGNAPGGTRPVAVGHQLRQDADGAASLRLPESAAAAPEDFWDADPNLPLPALTVRSTQPVASKEVETQRSKVARPIRESGSGRAPVAQRWSGLSDRTKLALVVGCGTALILLLLSIPFMLLRHRSAANDASARFANPSLHGRAVNRRRVPARPPQANPIPVVTTVPTNPTVTTAPTKSSEPPPPVFDAVYKIDIDPPNAQLTVSGGLALISGSGSKRQVALPTRPSNAAVTLIASAEGYQEARKELTPKSSLSESISFKLERTAASTIKAAEQKHARASPGVNDSARPQSAEDRESGIGASSSSNIQWNLVCQWVANQSDTGGIALSLDGTLVASTSADGFLRVWDAQTGVVKGEMNRMTDLRSVGFFKDKKRLFCGLGEGRLVEVWQESALAVMHSTGKSHTRDRYRVKPAAVFKHDPNERLGCTALSPDDRLLATGGTSGIVTIWDVALGHALRQVQYGSQHVPSPQPSSARRGPSFRRFATPAPPNTNQGSALVGLSFSPNSRQLACLGGSGPIVLCDVRNGKKVAELAGSSAGVLQAAYRAGGRQLAAVYDDGTLRIWDIERRQELDSLNTGIGKAVAYSPDGKWIAVAGNDDSLRILDAESLALVSVLSGQGGAVTHVVFSGRATRLATAGADKTIRVWDAILAKPVPAEGNLEMAHSDATKRQPPAVAEAKSTSAEPSSATPDPFAGTRCSQLRDDNELKMALLWMPPGRFEMGSERGLEHRQNEGPVNVTLTNGFWLGKYEVTQAQWQQLMHTGPWHNTSSDQDVKTGGDFPATYVDRESAMEFCRKLSADEHRAGRLPELWEYTLPSEAQWEYACKAGTSALYSFGKSTAALLDHAWFTRNTDSERYAHAVGSKTENPWGLFDMHGNVAEWCRDRYTKDLPGGADPEVSSGGTMWVVRGGGWRSRAEDLRSAARSAGSENQRTSALGFRVAAVRSAVREVHAAAPPSK